MLNQHFTLVGEDGNETVCELLFAFENVSTGKNYMVYTDHSPDEFGFETVFASIYDPSDETADLQAIESEEEWDLIDDLLEVLQDTSENSDSIEDVRLTVSYL